MSFWFWFFLLLPILMVALGYGGYESYYERWKRQQRYVFIETYDWKEFCQCL